MKKALGILLSLVMVISMQTASFAALPYINSQTYVVMEVKSGKVLASRGADTKKYPASITKILTCAIALEQGDPGDSHTMTYKATHSIEQGSTHIALTEEEVVTVNDLLNATMVESANDAANGLAEYIAGDIDNFPEMMNRKAQDVGAVNSHFMNSHGLYDSEHYTTAYDMAMITRWALEVEGFRELFGVESYVVPPTNKQPQERIMGTHHMMLVESEYYYEGTLGGKLGWTPESRHTMVTLAERGGMELICVVMDSRTQYEKFEDTINLLDYCYENYTVSEVVVDQFERSPIAVNDDSGEQVAEVLIPEQSFYIVHSPQIARADIRPSLTAPSSYHEDDEIEPWVIFRDSEGNELFTAELRWDYNTIDAAPVVGQPGVRKPIVDIPRMSLGLHWLWAIPITLVFALIVLLLVRHRNLKLREQRRLEKRRMLEQQLRESVLLRQGSNPPPRSYPPAGMGGMPSNRPASSRARTSGRQPIRGREGYRK